MRTTSLSRQVSFAQVLPLLGARLHANTLPAVADCPGCRGKGQLHVYRDRALGGEWAYCHQCQFAGNMISLAAEVWKLDTKLTLTKLVNSNIGVPEAVLAPGVISNYTRDHVKYDRRIRQFWQACQVDHVKQAEAGLRMLQRTLAAHNPPPDWTLRGGQFIGSSDRKKVTAFATPAGKVMMRTGTGHGPDYHVFHRAGAGRGWRDVLVVPFHDMPGRACGMLLIGREGRQADGDWLYLPLLESPASTDAGLCMLSSLLYGPHPQLGTTGFIFTNPEAALLLQMRHLREHRRPLPLAATWADDRRQTQNPEWLAHDDLILWGGQDRIEPISLARQRNARVSLAEITPAMMAKNLRHLSPREWLERLKDMVAPWQVALEVQLQNMSSSEIEATLKRLDLRGPDLTKFIAGCREELRRRLEYIEKHSTFARRTQFEGKWVYENGDSWFLEKGDERICNAVVRIDQVLTTRGQNGRSYYRGVIRFNGQQHPFTDRTDTLDKGLLAWAQGYLRDIVGAGLMEFYPAWNKRAIQLAIALNRPKMVSGIEAIGWDSENQQFNFPKWSLRRDGSVTDEYACLFDDNTVPGRNVPPPGAIPMKYMEALSDDNDETRIFWGVAAHITASIISQAINQPARALLLDGAGAQAVGISAAGRLGVVSRQVRRGRDPLVCAQKLLGPHGYPGIIESAAAGPWLEAPEAANLILCLPWVTNRVLAARGRWNMITCDRKLGSMQLVTAAATGVLPNYLQDVYSRGLAIGDGHDDLILNVLDDMANWFHRIGGRGATVDAARNMMVLPGIVKPWQHFLHLVFQLYHDGRLTFTKADFDRESQPKSDLVEVGHDGKLLMWVSQDRFSEAVRAVGALPPDLLLITKSLEEEGVLLSEPVYRDDRGWLLPNDWWNDYLKTWRST